MIKPISIKEIPEFKLTKFHSFGKNMSSEHQKFLTTLGFWEDTPIVKSQTGKTIETLKVGDSVYALDKQLTKDIFVTQVSKLEDIELSPKKVSLFEKFKNLFRKK